LIIWDDGSIDNTIDIIKSYSDKRLKYFHDNNHGVAYARNRAIEISLGKYLAFLDSDDEWLPSKLEAQMKVMHAYPRIDILFTNFLNFNGSTRQEQPIFEQYSDIIKSLNIEQMDVELFIVNSGIPESLTFENIIATDSVMVRREILKRIGGFSEELINSEDLELWWRMGLSGICFAYLNKVYLTRYKLSGTLSSSSILTCENNIKALDICLRETLSKGRNDLIPYLRTPYRNAWQNMILLLSDLGNCKGMIKAFYQSLKYGFRFGTIRLLLRAATNTWIYKRLDR
jgi:glycosyltransferase involved in cell wall biosynthesis